MVVVDDGGSSWPLGRVFGGDFDCIKGYMGAFQIFCFTDRRPKLIHKLAGIDLRCLVVLETEMQGLKALRRVGQQCKVHSPS